MKPKDRAEHWQIAYQTIENVLKIDTTSRSAQNLKKLQDKLESLLNDKTHEHLKKYRQLIENKVTEESLVLSHGSKTWSKINEYGWLLSDEGLEEEDLKHQNNTQNTDRKTWGNHDFVFFYLGFKSFFSNPGLQKKYGKIRLFSTSELIDKGWVSFGDWMDYFNTQEQQFSLGIMGNLKVRFEKPLEFSSLDERVKKTKKTYTLDGRRSNPIFSPLALDEFFRGADIIPALQSFLLLVLYTLNPPPIVLKRLGETLPEYFLGCCLPAIEAKLPRAVSLSQTREYVAPEGKDPVHATQGILSHG